MPTYDYRCPDHGDFEQQNRIADRAEGICPTCGSTCIKVILTAPVLDTEGMADIGMPSAFEKSGDRMTKRHQKAGQTTHYWRDDYNATNAEVA